MQCYSVAEASRLLGISRSYLYRLIAQSALMTIKVGKRRLISERAIAEFVGHREGRKGPKA